jgi:uncharacterized protein (TIGR00725 family)
MGSAASTPRARELAHRVGVLIARAGAILVCGGRTGVMEAAAAGAKEAGGLTVGILPGASAAEANPHIDIPIVTDLGNARNVINVLSSHAVVAVHGGCGTLSEIALALKCGVPVVGLETWSIATPEGEAPAGFSTARSAEEAVRLALGLARRQAESGPGSA